MSDDTHTSDERRPGYDGTGPGAITPDGCAVEMWLRLPAGDAPDVIEAAVPAGAHILELGCGVGRMTHPLADRGFTVTAVDESADMLARVRPQVRTVRSPIERLDLGERFDVVLLASFLVHAGDAKVRQGLLETCRRHVAEDGCVLIQREGADVHRSVPRETPVGAGLARVVSSTPVGDGVHSVHVEYEFPDGRWTQTFLSRPLSDEQFERALAEAGLRIETHLTEDRVWVRARPTG
ncbi:methyltransferase [Streptomyces rubellomurinus subsp. indigoferus]|uniref:Methyltransferase n=1 Tax=Streptomyces rubellomurinus (strain ATCC 31215) TaxID=359131 RepID=A0A0F2TBZ9_STRR3|nr:class I SAM-dependent methyltransferase [Streptomyces rubellomurinus]KJS54850.1 methyltransferase [Streptomyces rubellomurinus subsp. indigoferus]KJS59262.1 methyltransferase [Streptomyces rubellomurinus]